jgi:lipopolysaccharide heptosyltransferase II
MSEKSKINKILFITLSNLGDVILTLPALDALRANFPEAKITVMVGPRPKEIFEENPFIERLIIFDKHAAWKDQSRLFRELKDQHFDLVVDLRNTFFGFALGSRYKTSPFSFLASTNMHRKERNLFILEEALKSLRPLAVAKDRVFSFTASDKAHIDSLLEKEGIAAADKVILVSPVTGGENKRWETDKFAQLCRQLCRDYKVILVGTKAHQDNSRYITQSCSAGVRDFTGLTNLKQLAYLMTRSSLLVTCDTGTAQLSSYLDTPTLVLFGPTDKKKYGPWSGRSVVLKKEIFCRPCQKAGCRFKTMDCMRLIKVEDVLREAKAILEHQSTRAPATSKKDEFKRILVARTDRIGDVLLSTPVLEALRKNYPSAYIAMMVSPYAKDIIEGNPYLDEVIIYDKDARHKSWFNSMKFSRRLAKKKFDLGLILHPTNRVHLVTFFAGIPKRIGYDRKSGFLLTERIKHTKQHGEKHELEYNLDLLRHIGIEPKDKKLYMPIRPDSEKWAEDLFRREGVKDSDKLLAIHPGASCPSKVWPQERFAEVAVALAKKHGFKILVVAGPKDVSLADSVAGRIKPAAINLAGRTSVSQLASVLKRCRLFISNDSGPVHLASAVGTPVISIFGRNQKGLSPKRWGPVGERDKILHKEVGCIECLAHNCQKQFACLKAISVEDVVKVAEQVIGTGTEK